MEPRTFTSQYEDDCQHCGGPIREGDEIAYIDAKIACTTCVAKDAD